MVFSAPPIKMNDLFIWYCNKIMHRFYYTFADLTSLAQ